MPLPFACPNKPRCPHPSLVHDVEDDEDESPRCCVEGCDCGARTAGALCAARIPAGVAARVGQTPDTMCALKSAHDALEHDDGHGLSWLGEPFSPRFRPLSAQDALLVGVECVLLDHVAELSGPEADANLAELAYRYLAVSGEDAVPEIRDALESAENLAATCPRCGGDPCSECGECPRQGCWDCRCDQRNRDDKKDREGADDV